jgi:hypothetical protein
MANVNEVELDEDENIILHLGQCIGYFPGTYAPHDLHGYTEGVIKELKQTDMGVEITTDRRDTLDWLKGIHISHDHAVAAEGQNNTSLELPNPEAARIETILNACRRQLRGLDHHIYADLLRNPTNNTDDLPAAAGSDLPSNTNYSASVNLTTDPTNSSPLQSSTTPPSLTAQIQVYFGDVTWEQSHTTTHIGLTLQSYVIHSKVYRQRSHR